MMICNLNDFFILRMHTIKFAKYGKFCCHDSHSPVARRQILKTNVELVLHHINVVLFVRMGGGSARVGQEFARKRSFRGYASVWHKIGVTRKW
jgi:hypothetical protein